MTHRTAPTGWPTSQRDALPPSARHLPSQHQGRIRRVGPPPPPSLSHTYAHRTITHTTHTHTYTYTRTYTCTRIHIYTHTHIRTHTHTRICKHARTHIHKHTLPPPPPLPPSLYPQHTRVCVQLQRQHRGQQVHSLDPRGVMRTMPCATCPLASYAPCLVPRALWCHARHALCHVTCDAMRVMPYVT